MSDALTKALEENTLSEGAKAVIVEAWETKLQEAREEISTQLRDEFAKKYENDKNNLVEAVEAMVNDSLATHVEELVEATKSKKAEKAKDKMKLQESIEAMQTFVETQLSVEIEQLRADRHARTAKVSQLDEMVKETLTKELLEFHQEKRKLVEDRVKHKIQSKKELAAAKKELVTKTAKKCESFVRESLAKELTQLKGELVEANKKHFGMKLFEAFAAEYGSSFFNSNKEVSKLLSVIEEQNKKIEESSKKIAERENQLTESLKKIQVAESRFARTKTMNELCGSLAGSKRKLMEELLENVPTGKLTESFNNYLPTILSETESKSTKVLNEGKTSSNDYVAFSGDRNPIFESSSESGSGVAGEILSVFRKMNNANK